MAVGVEHEWTIPDLFRMGWDGVGSEEWGWGAKVSASDRFILDLF